MPKIYQHALARQDIVEHFIYLAESANLAVAERFLKNTEDSFNELISNPLIGAPLTLRNPALAGIRKWRVKDFDNILIFYMPNHSDVSIVRILHAAQNWWNLLGLTDS